MAEQTRRYYVGQMTEFEKVISDEDVQKFAEVTGDHNPLHLDEEFAKNTIFGGRIAHGMIGAGIISGGLAMHLPGTGTTYLGQDLSFKRPVRIGERVKVQLEIVEITPKKKFDIAKIATHCRNEAGEVVIEGTATVILPETDEKLPEQEVKQALAEVEKLEEAQQQKQAQKQEAAQYEAAQQEAVQQQEEEEAV